MLHVIEVQKCSSLVALSWEPWPRALQDYAGWIAFIGGSEVAAGQPVPLQFQMEVVEEVFKVANCISSPFLALSFDLSKLTVSALLSPCIKDMVGRVVGRLVALSKSAAAPPVHQIDLVTPPASPVCGYQDLLDAASAPAIIDGGALESISEKPASGKKRSKKPPPEPKEDSITMKIAAVREVEQAYALSYLEDGDFQLSKANRFLLVKIRCLDKVKRMDKISEWARLMKQEQWINLLKDKVLVAKYGTMTLSTLRKLPAE